MMSRLTLALGLLAAGCTPEVVCEWSDADADADTASATTAATTAVATTPIFSTRPTSTETPESTVLDTGTVDDEPTADTGSLADSTPVDTGTRPPCGDAGIAGPGFVHTIWPDAHTGDEATAEPKVDVHDGQNGDNHEFRRHNVARAHISYWYTSSFQEAGEPDPSDGQWVDYAPDFEVLGAGRYEIIAHYRQTENRAAYEALYKVQHRDGETIIGRDQRIGDDYESLSLGVYEMCPGGFVRVEDPGVNSITFNQMEFVWVGP